MKIVLAALALPLVVPLTACGSTEDVPPTTETPVTASSQEPRASASEPYDAMTQAEQADLLKKYSEGINEVMTSGGGSAEAEQFVDDFQRQHGLSEADMVKVAEAWAADGTIGEPTCEALSEGVECVED